MSSNGPVDVVLDALRAAHKKIRPGNGRWAAQCPAHNDNDPSLSIATGDDGRALVHCHAGCTPDAITAALGLNVVELFPPDPDRPTPPPLTSWPAYAAAIGANTPPPPPAAAEPQPEPIRTIDGTYTYTDITGQPVARVTRYTLTNPTTGEISGKTFRQQAADGHGGWLPTLNGYEPPLYRLPAVHQALTAGLPILVVEGEKDADTAAAHGLTATCNAMGAGKWRPQHTTTLTGGHILLIPDRDTPGVNHARTVRDALTTAGATVAVFGPATGKDLTDHIKAGGGLPELVPVDLDNPDPFLNPSSSDDQPPQPDEEERRQARTLESELRLQRARRDARRHLDNEDAASNFRQPPYRADLTAELAIPDQPVTYLIDEVAPAGANITLTAPFKTGKTTLTNDLTRSLADGTPFLGRFTINNPTGRIAVFNYEVSDNQYRRWLRDLGITRTDRVSILNLRGYRLPLTTAHIEDWVVAWLKDHNITTWIIDPFARAFVGSGDENSNAEVGAFLDTVDVIKGRAGVENSFMPLHTGRDKESGDRARGATRLDDWADVRWILSKDIADQRYFRATGRDVDVPEEKLVYDAANRRLTLGGGDRYWEQMRRLDRVLYQRVREQPGIHTAELLDAGKHACGVGTTKAEGSRRRLIDGEYLRVENGPGGAHLHYLTGKQLAGLDEI